MANIFQTQIVPNKPKVLGEEQIFVYVPETSSAGNKGIASFNSRDFNIVKGDVSLKWPMSNMVTGADPLDHPSLTKLLPSEFQHTNIPVTVKNADGTSYTSTKAEVKLNRNNLDATAKPELVMLKSNDFVVTKVGNYNQYGVKWPYSHESGSYGLVKIAPNSAGLLKFDGLNNLEVDRTKLSTEYVTVHRWNEKFQDWNPPAGVNTVQNWFTRLEKTRLLLGMFETEVVLKAEYPASAELLGTFAYVVETATYWAVRITGGSPEWFNTGIDQLDDLTKVNRTDTVLITVEPSNSNDFATNLQGEQNVINIPYVPTAKYLHNWKASPLAFNQSEYSNEWYWAGTQSQFEALDLAEVPRGAFFNVDDTDIESGPAVDLLTVQEFENDLNAVGLNVRDLTRLVVTTDTATEDNKPLVITTVDGKKQLSVKELSGNKVMTTTATGEFATASFGESEVVTKVGDWSPGNIALVSSSSSVTSFDSGQVPGRLLESNGASSVRVRDGSADLNRLLLGGENGTLSSVNGTGVSGDYLVSAGPGAKPVWTAGPAAYVHLPQTRLTTNPSSTSQYNGGWVAVVLATAPVDGFKENCIYYY